MIVGRDVLLRVEKTDAQPAESVLEVFGLTIAGKHATAVNDVSFSVRPARSSASRELRETARPSLSRRLRDSAGLRGPHRI